MQPSLWHLRQTSAYWHTPSGLAQLAWEQRVLNAFAERVFGFYALSFELGQLHTTAHSTIGNVIRVGQQGPSDASMGIELDVHDWPIQDDALDYIVLPHVLEFASDPHAVLREAARCLRPGGSMSITAFNPNSLLGMQAGHTEIGHRSTWLTRSRLIDWLQLLNLHSDRGAFGQWRPIHSAPHSFDRMAWLDSAGERWWPQLANVFALRVVKRLSPDVRQLPLKKRSIFARVPLVPAANPHSTERSADPFTSPHSHD
jgi:SAM-dependent methyltransferase